MLRDRSGFAGGAIRFSDRVDQAGFTVVDMAHKGDDRRTDRQSFSGRVVDLFADCLVRDLMPFLFRCIDGDFAVEFLTEQLDGRFIFEEIVKSDDNSLQKELGDELGSFELHLWGQFFDCDRNSDGQSGVGLMVNIFFLMAHLLSASFTPMLVVFRVAKPLPILLRRNGFGAVSSSALCHGIL